METSQFDKKSKTSQSWLTVKQAGEGIFWVDPEGRIAMANETTQDFSGKTEIDLLGSMFWDIPLWPQEPTYKDKIFQAVQKAAGGQIIGTCPPVKRMLDQILKWTPRM